KDRERNRFGGMGAADVTDHISDEGKGGTNPDDETSQDVVDNWNKSDCDPPEFPFDNTIIGLQIPVPADADPGFYFNVMAGDYFIDLMVEQTNLYAERSINKNRPLRRESRLNV